MNKRICASLILTLALAAGLALLTILLLGGRLPVRAAPQAPTAELHVCPSGCTYSSIQAAVDAADPGDTIKVAAGVYQDVSARPGPAGYNGAPASGLITQVVYITKTVMIQGGYTTTDGFAGPPDPVAHPTILDAAQQGRVLVIAGSAQPLVAGLRLTGGDAAGLGGERFGDDGGGGVYVDAAATISNSQVYDNRADVGGGVYLMDVGNKVTVEGSVIMSNTARSGGGIGAYRSGPTLTGNTIISNTADYGGGLYLSTGSGATVSGNGFIANMARRSGGGVDLKYNDVTFSGNRFQSNTADFNGGGLSMYESDITQTNDVIADNVAGGAGSALYIRRMSLALVHTTIARNSGGDGSGIYVADWNGVYNTLALTNTVLVSHTVGITVTAGNTVTVNGILWDAATVVTISHPAAAIVTVQNQFTGDPRLALDGYHLAPGSAAIDRGVDTGVTVDIDGDPRPLNAGYDLGADEIQVRFVYLPLVIKNR